MFVFMEGFYLEGFLMGEPRYEKTDLSLQSTFPMKLYHNSDFEFLVNFSFIDLKKIPTLDQISDKSVQCILCLVVTILNPERELN